MIIKVVILAAFCAHFSLLYLPLTNHLTLLTIKATIFSKIYLNRKAFWM